MGITCGPGSFAVRNHLRSWDHLRTRTVLSLLRICDPLYLKKKCQQKITTSNFFSKNLFRCKVTEFKNGFSGAIGDENIENNSQLQ